MVRSRCRTKTETRRNDAGGDTELPRALATSCRGGHRAVVPVMPSVQPSSIFFISSRMTGARNAALLAHVCKHTRTRILAPPGAVARVFCHHPITSFGAPHPHGRAHFRTRHAVMLWCPLVRPKGLHLESLDRRSLHPHRPLPRTQSIRQRRGQGVTIQMIRVEKGTHFARSPWPHPPVRKRAPRRNHGPSRAYSRCTGVRCVERGRQVAALMNISFCKLNLRQASRRTTETCAPPKRHASSLSCSFAAAPYLRPPRSALNRELARCTLLGPGHHHGQPIQGHPARVSQVPGLGR